MPKSLLKSTYPCCVTKEARFKVYSWLPIQNFTKKCKCGKKYEVEHKWLAMKLNYQISKLTWEETK